MSTATKTLLALGTFVGLLGLGLVLLPLVIIASTAGSSGAAANSGCPPQTTSTHPDLTEEQAANATTIIAAAHEVGAGEHGAVIAIATAWQESRLRNLDHGDRDSLGLFQQRPSQGWGTPAQIRTPARAARAFFGRATHTHNPGLLDISGWESMPVAQAAQAVQRSADPTGAWFGQHEQLARQILVIHTAGATPVPRTITIAQANIPSGAPNIVDAMTQVVADTPDFVSLNEVAHRRTADLKPAGYDVYRDQPSDPRNQTHSTAVAWRTDTWTMTAGGRILMVPDGPQKWDAGRSATWVTLTDQTREVSIVSAHHMINPAKYPVHNPTVRRERQRLYREGMQRLQRLIRSLEPRGPVFVAGDFNSQYNADDPWGPRALLGEIELRPSFDFAGATPTHEQGGVIDYIFAQPAHAELTRQWTRAIPSDHLLLAATYTLTTQAVAAAGEICGPATAMTCPATPWPDLEAGLTPDALRVLRCVHQAFPEIDSYIGVADRPNNPDSSHPTGRALDVMIPEYSTLQGKALGDAIADWVRGHAHALGVHYIIWNDQIWSTPRAAAGWRPYTHPSGATDDTHAHRDHVHVDVYGNAAGTTTGGDWTLPIAGTYRLTARFGDCGAAWSSCHTGLDFAAPLGTQTLAAAGGTVVSAGWGGSYGQLVIIDHGAGVSTYYAHLLRPGVTAGERVQPGQPIGLVGSTGNSTGPHLHFEVRTNSGPTDPAGFLASRGLRP
ncbi:peptidoglycan DD-metalloendopeptidase family protein [Nocardioides limicola]|uniref:peptidoglycan DD-metalloendopeptidase family protein n=1 Tax=Nocardioides limicola TaxID=2803368 RepID=UPI00193B9E42|nr:peptidoglycan DD-metalloendopeptidase family protein [Nocardioides sp. DJM-14]